MSVTEQVYERLPIPLQHVACSIYGLREGRIRFGGYFRRYLADLQRTEFASAAEIEALQDAHVRDLIEHAWAHVPFYRERMRAAGLVPADVRTRADLVKMPLLTKEEVRAHGDALVATNIPRDRLIPRHTSGTTGKALNFYSTRESIAAQWAVWWRYRRRFGLDVGDLHANFTGKIVVPARQQRPPYWRWNWPARQALLNMQHLTPEKAPEVVAFLDRTPFVFWSGYPSVIHALVSSALEAGVRLQRGPRVVTTGAENMLDFQRRDIAAFTGAVLTDQYGFSEGCGNASQCEQFSYHEDPEYGVLECVNPVQQPDGALRGDIACTGFTNAGFPLIRYLVGDTGVWAPPGTRCPCGRQSAVLRRIEGRMDDYVITPEGRRIMRFDYVFKETHRVREAQVVQRDPAAITIRVVRRAGYGAADEQLIRDEIARWISERLRVEFEYVEEIEREANGKFRAVRSYLTGIPGAGPAGAPGEARSRDGGHAPQPS